MSESFSVSKPKTSEFSAPAGALCVQMTVPDDVNYIYLLEGFLARLSDPDNWSGPEADRIARAGVVEKAMVVTDWEACLVEEWRQDDFILSGQDIKVTVGSALNWSSLGGQFAGGNFTQTTPASTDRRAGYIVLRGGTYNIEVTTGKTSGSAIMRTWLDASTSTIDTDLYSAAAVINHIVTRTGIALSAGEHQFNVQVNGKNVASSGYRMDVGRVLFHRTGA